MLTQIKAQLLSNFCWGQPTIPASEFLEQQNPEEILSMFSTDNILSENQVELVMQFIANFTNWSTFADMYQSHYSSEVISLSLFYMFSKN